MTRLHKLRWLLFLHVIGQQKKSPADRNCKNFLNKREMLEARARSIVTRWRRSVSSLRRLVLTIIWRFFMITHPLCGRFHTILQFSYKTITLPTRNNTYTNCQTNDVFTEIPSNSWSSLVLRTGSSSQNIEVSVDVRARPDSAAFKLSSNVSFLVIRRNLYIWDEPVIDVAAIFES
jgi:hypothetical protein